MYSEERKGGIIMKKGLAISVVLIIMVSSIVPSLAYQGRNTGKAATLADLTGKSIEEILDERETKSYGQIAAENEVLEEYKQVAIENKEQVLQNQVTNGTITQGEADAQITAMEERQALCDGTGVCSYPDCPNYTTNTGTGLGVQGGQSQGQGNRGQGNQGQGNQGQGNRGQGKQQNPNCYLLP